MNAKELIDNKKIRQDVVFFENERNGCVSTSDGERLLSLRGGFHQIFAANMYMQALREISNLCKKIEELEARIK